MHYVSVPTVLFVGGGSLGHIAPSIAVAQALQALRPKVRAHFVCLPSEAETDFIAAHGFESSTIDAPRMGLPFLWKFPRALAQANRLAGEIKPAVVFSKGGYVSVPVCIVAHVMKVPIVLHESDAVSGYANRFIGRWSDRVCMGFSHTKYEIRNTKYELTGNPVRASVTQGSRAEGLHITGFSGDRPVLLVIGGSQGAKAINAIVAAKLGELLELCDVVHVTGKGKGNSDRKHGYFQCEFSIEQLPHLYAITDLAISRAGAGGLAELAANGIPTIVVPLRGVGHDHQLHNAEAAEQSGGCIHLEQGELSLRLIPAVKEIFADREKHSGMAKAVRSLAAPWASRRIAEILSEYLAAGEGHP